MVSLGLAMPTTLLDATRALAADAPARQPGKILVVIEMAGGNDGLNTIAPLKNKLYAQNRPGLGFKEADAHGIDRDLFLHPNLKGLKSIYEKGNLAVVNGVGYPNPNRSHFASMDIWQSANVELDARERSGWLARFDEQGHYTGDQKSLSMIATGGSLPLALWGEKSAASVVGNGYNFGFEPRGGDGQTQVETLKALYGSTDLSSATVAGNARSFLANVGQEVYASTDTIKAALRTYDTSAGQKAKYPQYTGIADGLQTVAKLIGGGLPTRVYYVSMGGFDTHSNQNWQHGQLMQQLGDALAAFQEDLRMMGRDKDVLTMTFSEFGRRVKENGSGGTDHGSAGMMFIAGGAVKGGVMSDYPSLEDLDDGDLKMTTDFRSVYSTVIGNWMKSDPTAVLGSEFKPLAFV